MRQAKLRDPGYTHFHRGGVDAECLVSETPVSGLRIVRPKDYPIGPAHYLSSNLYTTTGTFLQIDAGVPFAIANLKVDGQTTSMPARSLMPAGLLAITVVPPVCPSM